MKLTGKIESAYFDAFSGDMKLILSVKEKHVISDHYEEYKDKDLQIDISQYRKKRSLDANAYFHCLLSKLAEKMGCSNAYCKNYLIAKYGQPMILPDGSMMVYKTNAPEDYMMEQETVHTRAVKYEDTATFYRVFRGSHEYNTQEMARLIDGTVQDCKEWGIETLTPRELADMYERWGKKHEINNTD